jgi:urease accessory protein
MHARASIVAEPDGRDGTRLTRLRGESPLLLRYTPGHAHVPTVHLVGGAAGPLGGDDLRLEIDIRPGAALCLRTVAASIALPARSGAASRFVVQASVGAGAVLHWLPEPTVAAAGCHHVARATVDVAEGGALRWRDELVCGRYGEAPGAVTVTTVVWYAGRPLLHQSLRVGPGADGWAGPAVLGGAIATGSLLQVDPFVPAPAPPCVLGPTAIRVPLVGPATLITATAPDAHALRQMLDARSDRGDQAVRVRDLAGAAAPSTVGGPDS